MTFKQLLESDFNVEITGLSRWGGFAGATEENILKFISMDEINQIVQWLYSSKGTYRFYVSQNPKNEEISISVMKGNNVQRDCTAKIESGKIIVIAETEKGGGTKKGSVFVYPNGKYYKELNKKDLIITRSK